MSQLGQISSTTGDQLKQKVALVTGGAGGIGLAISRVLLAKGAKVAVLDIQKIPQELKNLGVVELLGDVASEHYVSWAIEVVQQQLGRLDILVNNAAILGRGRPVESVTAEELNRIIDVNLKGPIWTVRYAVPLMKQQGRGGSIINISSIRGLTGSPGFPLYSATKAALIGLTKSWAKDLGRYQIRVNCICPGSVGGTQLTSGVRSCGLIKQATLSIIKKIPLGRKGRPEDIASLVVYLVLPEASFINGSIIIADGGETLGP